MPATLLESKKSMAKQDSFLRRCAPTFLGIGSMRCGSTWLYEVLKCHPDIRVSDRKEMHFFFMREMLQHDLDWYNAHFEPENGGEPKPVRGEISPVYARLKAWQVNRIAKLLPDLRIILTLRHPIERAWSQALLDLGYLNGSDMRTIRGKVRLSWRILKALNLALLSVPERLGYEVYHAALDARLWRRWQHFQRSYVSDYDHAAAN